MKDTRGTAVAGRHLPPQPSVRAGWGGHSAAVAAGPAAAPSPRRGLGMRVLSLQTGLIALLLPMAAGLSAQTPLRWDGQTPAVQGLNAVYSPHATMTRVYPGAGLKVMPLAEGFDVAEFERIAQSLIDERKVPGMAMAIVQGGRVLSARGYGVTDVNSGERVDEHTVFRLASLSKSFASTAAALAVHDGDLRWDSRVVDYVPTLQFSDPSAASRLTVAEVLSHRVGLVRNAYDRDIERNADYVSLVHKMANAPMRCGPGECYAYQNVAYSLIGDAIAGASGKSFEQYVAHRVFRRLGMSDASYGLDGIAASRSWARPHVYGRGGWTSLYPKPTYYRVAPAAGVNASINDMSKWLLAQSGYRPDVLPGALLATLHAPLIDTPGELHGSGWRRERLNAAGYGLGWRIYDYAGHRMVFHGGVVQGYRGAIALLPERDLGVVLLWNGATAAPTGLMPTILDRAIGLHDRQWIEVDDEAPSLFAERGLPPLPVGETDETPVGAAGSVSNAKPY